MKSPVQPPVPAFRIPLSPEQLAIVGQISLMWGQIDFLLVRCIALIHRLDLDQFNLLLPNQMTSSRVDILSNSLRWIGKPDLKEIATSVCKKLRAVTASRNLVMHGMWGMHVTRRGRAARPAAMGSKNRKDTYYASNLPTLHKDIAEITHLMTDLWYGLQGKANPYPGQAVLLQFRDDKLPAWL